MKKVFIFVLCLMLLLCGCSEFTYAPEENPEWVQAGMKTQEFCNELMAKGYEEGGIYMYYTTAKKGDQVIVVLNDIYGKNWDEVTVVEVRTYTISQLPPDENYTKIGKGMDLFQVVELIGDVPVSADSTTTTSHQDRKGNIYRVQWVYDEELQKAVVHDVYLFEE